MRKKLCCMVKRHVTCSQCKRSWCIDCWPEGYLVHVYRGTWSCNNKRLALYSENYGCSAVGTAAAEGAPPYILKQVGD
jgi:hypothetical protein